MKKRPSYHDLEVFLTVAKLGGVRKAALAKDVTPSAISLSLKNLESRLGTRLFHRFNNSLHLTSAGYDLRDALLPSFEQIEMALEAVEKSHNAPSGKLKITVIRDVMHVLLQDKIPPFIRDYPDIELDISLDDRFVGITEAGFDMGIRYHDRVPEGMAASPLTGDLDWIVVGAPSYLETHGYPASPEDLLTHQCIRIRMGDGRLFPWELGAGDNTVRCDVPGSLILGDTAASIDLASKGFGLFYCLEKRVAAELQSGALEILLPEWTSPGPGFCAYYTAGHHVPRALRVFLDYIKS